VDSIVLSRLSEEERKIFDDVDEVISRSVVVGDPLIALDYGASLKRKQTIEGVSLAKLLFKLRESWGLYQARGIEDDLLTMADLHMDVKPATAKKYMAMWESIFENEAVPDDIKSILSGRKVSDLLLLTAAVGEGTLSGEDLKSAALSSDTNELREHIHKVRGEQTSAKTAIRICLNMVDKENMRAGTLYAKRGDEREVLDFTAYAKGTASELTQKAINRLINSAGVIEVFS
jgi:hypothetical protein